MDVREEISKIIFDCVGKDYFSGYSGPDAFDRQGLIYYIFNTAGIPFPRKIINEYYYDEIYLMDVISQPQTGDIVFYGENGYSYSAGIYVEQSDTDGLVCLINLGKESDPAFTQDLKVEIIDLNNYARSDFLKIRRHRFLASIIELQNSETLYTESNTTKYDGYQDITESVTPEQQEATVNFSIETKIYNAVEDKEDSIISNFIKNVKFNSLKKGMVSLSGDIIATVKNNTEQYTISSSLDEDDVDILEYIIDSSDSEIYCVFENSKTRVTYDLTQSIIVYNKDVHIIADAPLLFSTVCERNVLFQWRFENKPLYAYSYKLYQNNICIFNSVSFINYFVLQELSFNESYEFYLEAYHPIGGTLKSETVTLYFEKEQSLELFRNTFLLPETDPLDTNKFDFNVWTEVINREYPVIQSNIVLMVKRILDEPVYPYNFFRMDLIGEKQRGTEFYYDIQTEITTRDNLSFNVITPMFYYNQDDNGSMDNLLALSTRSVFDLSRDNVVQSLQDNNENYVDKVKPTFYIDYSFKNTIPFEATVSLFKQEEHEFTVPETSNTEVYVDLKIPNTKNLTIAQFINQMHLYCPKQKKEKVVQFSVIRNGLEYMVEGSII